MSELYIGTSGYDYPEWLGEFYPQKLARSKFLEYYSTQFNSLELNGTYYKMPSPQQMQNMVVRSGGRIKFTVKAFKDITHAIDKTRYQQLINEFKKALEPLTNDNLLFCALLQFPESFRYEIQERLYLDALLKEVADIPVVVEMRNKKWQNDQVYKALRQRKVGWCITDNPALKNLPALDYIITSSIAYMRFHGRNAEMWYKGDNATRYDYMYLDFELQSFVEPIKRLAESAQILQLFFNNHVKGQAPKNAKKLETLLRDL
jgi:uncharacterized protein YecE (DUF72 family)